MSNKTKFIYPENHCNKNMLGKKREREGKKKESKVEWFGLSASLYYLILINVALSSLLLLRALQPKHMFGSGMFYHHNNQFSWFTRLSFDMNSASKIPNAKCRKSHSKRPTSATATAANQTDSHNTIDSVNRRMKEIALQRSQCGVFVCAILIEPNEQIRNMAIGWPKDKQKRRKGKTEARKKKKQTPATAYASASRSQCGWLWMVWHRFTCINKQIIKYLSVIRK